MLEKRAQMSPTMHQAGFLAVNETDNTTDFVSELSVNHSLALVSHFAPDFSIKRFIGSVLQWHIHSYDFFSMTWVGQGVSDREHAKESMCDFICWLYFGF